jgi:hypothetical protein
LGLGQERTQSLRQPLQVGRFQARKRAGQRRLVAYQQGIGQVMAGACRAQKAAPPIRPVFHPRNQAMPVQLVRHPAGFWPAHVEDRSQPANGRLSPMGNYQERFQLHYR